MVRGVFFDLDNTLIPTRAAQRTALAASWATVLGPSGAVDAMALQKAVRNAYEARFGYGTPGYGELAHIELHALARWIWTDVLAQWGLLAADRVERLILAYGDAERAALSISAETIDTLQALQSAGLRLGLITNGPSGVQRGKLATLGLAEFFEVIVVDSEFGCPKPDRRIFEHAAASVRLTAADLWFVGDRLTEDINGARSAGWRSVWYNPVGEPLPPNAVAPDLTIRRLDDLLSVPEIAALSGRQTARRGAND